MSAAHRAGLRLGIAVVLILAALAPGAALLSLAGDDTCACGMKGGCLCRLTAPQAPNGAHCSMGSGGCSMRSCNPPPEDAWLASLDLRGWLFPHTSGLLAGMSPSGPVAPETARRPRRSSDRPEPPPPRSSQILRAFA